MSTWLREDGLCSRRYCQQASSDDSTAPPGGGDRNWAPSDCGVSLFLRRFAAGFGIAVHSSESASRLFRFFPDNFPARDYGVILLDVA